MSIMSTYLKRIPVSVALLLGLFLASSCGVENAPLSSTDAEVQVAHENAGLLVFGFGDEPAAKKVKGAKRSKTAKVGKKGATLKLNKAGRAASRRWRTRLGISSTWRTTVMKHSDARFPGYSGSASKTG